MPFDPSKPFEELDAPPKFDPNQPFEEVDLGEKTSALGAAGRSAATGVLPSAAFATTAGAVFPWATGLAAETGPFAPVIGGAASLIAGAGAAGLAALAQKKIAETVAPETTKRFEELQAADAAQHPVASFGGELASGIPSMRVSPGTVIRGARLLPRVISGLASKAEREAVGEAAGRVVGGAAAGAVLPVITEGRLPTWKDVAEGTAYATTFGEVRWKAPGAAAGKRFMARRISQFQRPETQQTESETPDASSQQSATQVGVRSEGTGVGESPPLRQQGEVAQTSPEVPPVVAPEEAKANEPVQLNKEPILKTGVPFSTLAYHGRRTDHAQLTPAKNAAFGEGIYFTDSPAGASFYAGSESNESGGNVVPVSILMKNPLVITEGQVWKAQNYQQKGFDGVIVKPVKTRFGNETWFIVPSLEQVKSTLEKKAEASQPNPSMDRTVPAKDETKPQIGGEINGKGSMPDQAAQAAFEAGILKEPSVNELWSAIDKSSKSRISAGKGEDKMAKAQASELAQYDNWTKATKQEKGKVEVTTEDLAPGDLLEVNGERVEVTQVDPENGDVTLKDGSQFGKQVLEEGKRIYVENFDRGEGDASFPTVEESKPMKPSLTLAAPETVEEQNARLAAEKEAKAKAAQKTPAELLAEGAAKPLVGSVGDIGQTDLAGGTDLFSAPPTGKPSDIANAIADSLDNIKSGRRPGDLNLFGVVPALWDKAIEVAQAVIRAGGTVADAVAKALEYILANHKGAWDEVKASTYLQAATRQAEIAQGPPHVPTEVMGQTDYVRDRIRMTPESTQESRDHAKTIFDEAKIPVVPDLSVGGWRIDAQGQEHNFEGRRLVELLDRELTTPDSPTRNNATLLGSLINSIRLNFKAGHMSEAFDRPIQEALYKLAQGESSHRGMALGALSQHATDVRYAGENVDVTLSRTFYDAFSSDALGKFLKAVKRHFGQFFNDEVINGALSANPALADALEALRKRRGVDKLVPSVRELIRQIFETPFYRKKDIVENFKATLIDKLKASDGEADEMAVLFEKAFRRNLDMASKQAFKKAQAALTPKEAQEITKKKYVWQKIEEAANAGNFDEGTSVREIAKGYGWNPLNADEMAARLKSLAGQEQKLREHSPTEIAKLVADGKTPEEIERARQDKEAITTPQRSAILKEMGVEWARLTHPLPKEFWRRWPDWAQALQQLETFNMLAKVGFTAYRLPMHLTTQLMGHLPTRAIGRAFELHQGEFLKGTLTNEFWRDVGSAFHDSAQATLAAIRPALISARAELAGRGEGRNVERLVGDSYALERLFRKAKADWDKGNYVQSVIQHFFAWPRVMAWYISAVDHWQGTPVEYQEMIHQIELEMRQNGRNRAEIDTFKDQVFKLMSGEIVKATTDAQHVLAANGLDTSPANVSESAWKLVRRRIYQTMEKRNLPADDFEADNKILADTQSWQTPTRGGPGMLVAAPLQWAGKFLPLPLSRFSNAIATSINYSFMWTPLYKLANVAWPKNQGSTWFRTSLDRNQRLAQALLGTALGGTALSLMAIGALRMTPPWIRDKTERDAFEAAGHKLNTAEFVGPDGSFVPISTLVGPLTLIAPYLYFGGALQRLCQKRAGEQAKLNAEAAKKGLTPGKIRPIDTLDLLGIAGETAWGAILGNRTASGLTASVSEYGVLNARKQVASQIAPLAPGLPGYQEISRMMGVSLDSHLATVWDYLVPLPTSQARALNILGDPVGTPDALQRTIQTITSGTYPALVHPEQQKDAAAYAALAASGYHAPAINPSKGFDVNGEFRPLNNAELANYTENRGKAFKATLSALGSNADHDSVKAAFAQADQQALESVGAAKAKNLPKPSGVGLAGISRGTSPKVSTIGGGARRGRLSGLGRRGRGGGSLRRSSRGRVRRISAFSRPSGVSRRRKALV